MNATPHPFSPRAVHAVEAIETRVASVRLAGRTVVLTCRDFPGAFAVHATLAALRDAGAEAGLPIYRDAVALADVLSRLEFAASEEEEQMLHRQRDELAARLRKAVQS